MGNLLEFLQKLPFCIPICYHVTNAISMPIMLQMSPSVAPVSFLVPNAHPWWCHSIENDVKQDFQKEKFMSWTGQGSSKARSTTGEHAVAAGQGGSPSSVPGQQVGLSHPELSSRPSE